MREKKRKKTTDEQAIDEIARIAVEFNTWRISSTDAMLKVVDIVISQKLYGKHEREAVKLPQIPKNVQDMQMRLCKGSLRPLIED